IMSKRCARRWQRRSPRWGCDCRQAKPAWHTLAMDSTSWVFTSDGCVNAEAANGSYKALKRGDCLDQGTGEGHDIQINSAPRAGLHDGLSWASPTGMGELFSPWCIQSHLQRDRLLHLGAHHSLAAEETPHRVARTETPILCP